MTDGPKDTASSRGSDPVDTAEAAAVLRGLLAAVEKGELSASAIAIARIEGARVALEELKDPE